MKSLFLLCIVWLEILFARVSDRQIASIFILGFEGTKVGPRSRIINDLCRKGLEGVILFDRHPTRKGAAKNIASARQLQQLIRQLKSCGRDPLIAVDQEGGVVQRLRRRNGFGLETPKALEVRKRGEVFARKVYEQMAKELATEGINYNLAPVADLDLNPANRVIHHWGRSYGADPALVARYDEIFIRAMHRYGVLTALKHFPGHGSSTGDTHKGFVDVSDEWRPIELEPYRRLIAKGVVDSIMVAHLFNRHLDSRLPASLSRKVIDGLLRGKLGYRGVVITDDLQMGAIVKHYSLRETVRLALLAGNDLLLFGNQLDPKHFVTLDQLLKVVRSLLKTGEIREERILEANRRIREMKKRIGLR